MSSKTEQKTRPRIEHHTPVDGDYYLINDGNRMFAKAWEKKDAEFIASAKDVQRDLIKILCELLKASEKELNQTVTDEGITNCNLLAKVRGIISKHGEITVNIYQDGNLKQTLTGDEAENNAFAWLLRNQGQSTDHALRYGGWRVEVISADGSTNDWKPYSTTKKSKK